LRKRSRFGDDIGVGSHAAGGGGAGGVGGKGAVKLVSGGSSEEEEEDGGGLMSLMGSLPFAEYLNLLVYEALSY
jgi:hypothetical protein